MPQSQQLTRRLIRSPAPTGELLLNSDIEETQGQALFDALYRGLTHFTRNPQSTTPS